MVKSLKAVDAQTEAGRAIEHQQDASASPAQRHVRQVRWEDEQAEDDEERDLRREREPLVERDEVAPVAGRRAADREADEVDREEAAAADHVGDAEGERGRRERRHRREGADRVREAAEDPDRDRAEHDPDERGRARAAGRRAGAGRRSRSRRGRSIQAIRPSVSAIAIGSLPPDSASSVRASRRRMCVKRSVAKTAAASVEETTAPSSTDSSHERSKSMYAATPVDDGADDDADRAQERRRHRDLAQPPPRGLQAALVEDQRQPDDPDLARELRVVELDPAGPVRAEQHPDRQEGRRAPASPCAQRRARRQCCPPGCRRRAGAEGPRPRFYLCRWESRAAAWNTSGMATRPRTRKIGRLSEIAQVAVRHGFGYFFERHKLTDVLPWTDAGRAGRRGGCRLGARAAPARDARRARPDVRQVRPAALDAARRRPAGHRRRAARPPGRRDARSRSRRCARWSRRSSA